MFQVGIVAFSDSADTPPGEDRTSTCYSEQLTTAVGVNLKYLAKYLRNIKTRGKDSNSSGFISESCVNVEAKLCKFEYGSEFV